MSRLQSGNSHLLGLLAVAFILCGAVAFIFLTGDPSTDPLPIPPVVETQEPEELEEVPALEHVGIERDSTGFDRTESPTSETVDEFGDPTGGVIRGRVVDGQGQPIAEAMIELTQRYSSNTMMRGYERGERFLAHSAADGTFRFKNLAAGVELNMWISHPDFASSQGPPFAPLLGETQDLGDIELGAGFSIEGLVMDEARNPLPGLVEVRMQANDPFRVGSQVEKREEDTESRRLFLVEADADGKFTVERLAGGIWTVTASLEGFSTTAKKPVALHGKPRKHETVIQLKLGREYIIQGIVEDENRKPIAGALINVSRSQPRPVITAEAISDENGQFKVRGLQEGTYGLSAQAAGYSNGRAGRVQADTTDLIMVLMDKGGISGRVSTASGQPVTKFSLEVLRSRPGNAQYGITGSVYRLESADGSYTIKDLDPGSYLLLARADGYAATYSSGFNIDREQLDGIDIAMKAGGTVRGRVVDSDGNPLAQAEISLHGQSFDPKGLNSLFGATLGDADNIPSHKVRSDAEGRFVMENAYAGDVQLFFEHGEHLGQAVPATILEGAQVDLGDIRLYRGGAIFGMVRDHEGGLLTGGTVTLTRKDSNDFFHRSTTVDARGRYSFKGLETGTYEVVAIPSSLQNTFLFPPDQDKQTLYVKEGDEREADLSSTLGRPEKK